MMKLSLDIQFKKEKAKDIDEREPFWRSLSKAFIESLEMFIFTYNFTFLVCIIILKYSSPWIRTNIYHFITPNSLKDIFHLPIWICLSSLCLGPRGSASWGLNQEIPLSSSLRLDLLMGKGRENGETGNNKLKYSIVSSSCKLPWVG